MRSEKDSQKMGLLVVIVMVTLLSLLGILNPVSSLSEGESDTSLTITDGMIGNVSYCLYSDGTLIISGFGRMVDNFDDLFDDDWANKSPWGGPYASSIRSVIIEDGVISIANEAFSNLVNLESVSLPSSLTDIGFSAFENCVSIDSITIPSNVSVIRGGAFLGCTSLKTVVNHSPLFLVKGSTYDGHVSFYADAVSNVYGNIGIVISGDCGDDVRYTLDSEGTLTLCGNGDPYVYDVVWYNGHLSTSAPWGGQYASSVRKVVICDGVGTIGTNLFVGCTGITCFDGDYCGIYGSDILLSPDCRTLVACTAAYSSPQMSIPSFVTGLGPLVFAGCTDLESVSIPSSVVSIGDRAFIGCTSLVEFSGSYPNIPDGNVLLSPDGHTLVAYAAGSPMESVDLPLTVNEIGREAFRGSKNLTSLTVPFTLTSVGCDAFLDCTSLRTIVNNSKLHFTEGSDSYGLIAYYATDVTNLFETSSVLSNGTCGDGVEYTLVSDGTLTIYGTGPIDDYSTVNYKGSTVTNAPWGKAYATLVKNVVIGEGVTHVGDCTYYSCDSIITVDLPSSLKSIGFEAFYSCRSLTEIVLPSVSSISDWAFMDCEMLKHVYLPSSLRFIGYNVFTGTLSLENFTGDYIGIADDGKLLLSPDLGTLVGCASGSSVRSVVIPFPVTKVR
ncbi:MAG: leucine-rich repeat domain-containing protein, partial [archaeon]|nr:leucine-rich repeat domain-containing protein [archaeon]